MSSIEPRLGSLPEPQTLRARRAYRAITDKVRLDGLEVAGEVALGELTMDLFRQMTYRRRQLAGTDEELGAILLSIQLGCMARVERRLDSRHSPFGL